MKVINLLMRIRELSRKVNKKILRDVLLLSIPILILMMFGAYVLDKNGKELSNATKISLPCALLYNQLEKNILKMQKWISYTCATRAEKGYDNGFDETEHFYNLSQQDIKRLEKILKDNPKEMKRLADIRTEIDNYYNLGLEVAKAYIEAGTFYGNEMLDTLSIVEKKINTDLRTSVTYYTEDTIRINKSLESVLDFTKILFLVLGLLVCILVVVSYKFMVNRSDLRSSNDKLSEAMDSLWGEMQLAKKIQTVLLPENPSVKGYEISAQMIPAQVVGGDYYDVINAEGRDWLIIGDVSGHGISAGLIMMMMKISIQTTLAQHPSISPSHLLNAINHVIAKNIHMLGGDKYITITALTAHGNGEFIFSGHHQDIMIYRSNSSSIDLIETTGMWIGILNDITNMNVDSTFSMNSGDILLLYTDGITEAIDENDNIFSQKQLENILERFGNSNASVEEIKKGILMELESYIMHDDVTMLILKML